MKRNPMTHIVIKATPLITMGLTFIAASTATIWFADNTGSVVAADTGPEQPRAVRRGVPASQAAKARARRSTVSRSRSSSKERNQRNGVPSADSKPAGGEPNSIIQIANLIYAGTKSSECFSDHFLTQVEADSVISTSRRFYAIKLNSEDLFGFPLVIMTGEGSFFLSGRERDHLKQFVEGGGLLLASAGCSSEEWDRSFRQEIARIFPDHPLQALGMEHPVFHTVYDIKGLRAKNGRPHPLEGITIGGRLGVLYSQNGLNDTSHVEGCCCCGGDEITNAAEVNVNVLAHALIY